MPRALLLAALVACGCVTARPAPPTEAPEEVEQPAPPKVQTPPPLAKPAPVQPLTGTSISKWRTDDGLEIEVLALASVGPSLGDPAFGGPVATTQAQLPAAFRPATPIDFTRFVALTIPGGATAPPLVVELEPQAVHRVVPEQTEIIFSPDDSECGGASIVAARNQQRFLTRPPTVVLVPRPPRKLVIGFIASRCPANLP